MEVQETYGDQVRLIGVPGLANVADMSQFVAERGVNVIDHIPDPDGAIWERFGITQHRAYVLINDDGTFETTGYGSIEEDIQALIER